MRAAHLAITGASRSRFVTCRRVRRLAHWMGERRLSKIRARAEAMESAVAEVGEGPARVLSRGAMEIVWW